MKMEENNIIDFETYRIALAEVIKKLNIMLFIFNENREFGYIVGGRIKDSESIQLKINKKEKTGDFVSVSDSISDIAGCRVVFCDVRYELVKLDELNDIIASLSREEFTYEMFDFLQNDKNCDVDVIYKFVDYFCKCSGMKIIEMNDYIRDPKDSGYQSLHLVVETNKGIKVEIQFRNLVQHLWAESEHREIYNSKKSDEDISNNDLFYQKLAPFVHKSSKSNKKKSKVKRITK